VEAGFDQERVREAFDSFYRHLARLDTTLRALEAVDVFKGQATELRKELRALRLGGWTQQPWQPYSSARPPLRTGLPAAVPRLAIETIFIIAVAVGSYEAGLRPLVLAGVMALAVLIVGVLEWAAARERVVVPPAPRSTAEPEPDAAERAAVPLPPVVDAGWQAPAVAVEPEPEPESEPEAEALTAIAPGAATAPEASDQAEEPADAPVQDVEPEHDAAEPEAVDEPEPEPEPEPELIPAAEVNGAEGRRRWWRRGRRDDEAAEVSSQPRHVRVLPAEAGSSAPGQRLLDPWEEDFDLSIEDEPAGDGTGEEPAPQSQA